MTADKFEALLEKAASAIVFTYFPEHRRTDKQDIRDVMLIIKKEIAPLRAEHEAMDSLFQHVIEILNDSNESMTTARNKIKREIEALRAAQQKGGSDATK